MKRFHSSVVSLLVFLAAALLGTAAARGQAVSPVPAPTIITSAPYTISSAGYYQLGANLTVSATSGNIITVNASNVTLDFGGHYISGPTPTPSATTLNGVYALERANLIIQNGTISHCQVGVVLEGNGTGTTNNLNGIVRNMLINACSSTGVYLVYHNNGTVTQNRITGLGGGNTSNHSQYANGIFFDFGSGNTASNNTIEGIAVSGSGAYGIYGAGGCTAIGNSISNITAPSGTDAVGVDGVDFAVGNLITNAQTGFSSCTKYKDNLTANVATLATGGTAVGTNN